MPVSEKNVFELTRLYLKYRADNEELRGNFNDAGVGQSVRNKSYRIYVCTTFVDDQSTLKRKFESSIDEVFLSFSYEI